MISKDTAHSITCISCMLDGLVVLILSWFDREGRQKVQVVCKTAHVVSKSRHRECPIRVPLPRPVPCAAPAHMLKGCSEIKGYRWKEACCPRCLSGPARQVLSADVFLLGNSLV